MTVSTTDSTISYAGNDVTTTFGIPFEYQRDTDLIVTVTVVATSVTTTWVLGSDYTVNPDNNSPATNGSVLATVPVASGSTITIRRAVPLTQETTWQTNDAYPANFYRMENALDKLTMAIQDVTTQPLDPGGDTSTFVRGDGSLSNTLIGSQGAVTVPTDVQSIIIGANNGAAAIKVNSGATAQGAFRYGIDGDTNAWAMQWVYDPNIGAIGAQAYGGSIFATFDNTGNVAFTGDLAVTGDISFGTLTGDLNADNLASGTVPLARLGTNSPDATKFLNGANQWAIPSSGGGGVNTTTTGTFVVAAVASTQTVPVTSATGITVGNYLLISDGTHTIVGQVTAIASLNLTVKTIQIITGSAADTMASGAAVQLSSVPGTNAIQFEDGFIGPITSSL